MKKNGDRRRTCLAVRMTTPYTRASVPRYRGSGQTQKQEQIERTRRGTHGHASTTEPYRRKNMSLRAVASYIRVKRFYFWSYQDSDWSPQGSSFSGWAHATDTKTKVSRVYIFERKATSPSIQRGGRQNVSRSPPPPPSWGGLHL